LILIQKFIDTFGWLVESIEGIKFRKDAIPTAEFKAANLFQKEEDVNIKLYK